MDTRPVLRETLTDAEGRYLLHLMQVRDKIRKATCNILTCPYDAIAKIAKRGDEERAILTIYDGDDNGLLDNTCTLLCWIRDKMSRPLSEMDRACYVVCIDELLDPLRKLHIPSAN